MRHVPDLTKGSASGEPLEARRLQFVAPAAADSGTSELISPSLLSKPGKVASFELKFVVTEQIAGSVELWAQRHLGLDAHANPHQGNGYRIHGLYLDTPALDVYHRTPTYRRRKYRLRRYGSESGVYLERKTRAGERVRKRRTFIPATEIERLQSGQAYSTWDANWFHQRVRARGLTPICQIMYDRIAYVGSTNHGPLRLTMDRGIVCAPCSHWAVDEPKPGLTLLKGQVVLELKYRQALPLPFKQLVQEFNLNPRPASKYRQSIEAWGLQARAREVG
jgi:hypothetical protein